MDAELTIRVEEAVSEVKPQVEEAVSEVKGALAKEVEVVEAALNGKTWSCVCSGWTYTCTTTKNATPVVK